MKIIVLMKEIIDTRENVVIGRDNKIDESKFKHVVNIYDSYALEEAIQIKEKFGGEVVIYSVGKDSTVTTISHIMSMGADRAVIIKSDNTDAITVSELLAKKIQEKDSDFDLILAGWMGIDQNRGEVPGRVSRLLNIPFINVAVQVDINGDKITCEKEGEKSNEIVETNTPAIITVQRGINEPRYPSLYNIFSTEEKNIEIIEEKTESKNKRKIDYAKKGKDPYMIEEEDPKKAVKKLIEKMMEDKVI